MINSNKEKLFKEYKDVCGAFGVSSLSRNDWRKFSSIPCSQVTKEFGSYTKFKSEYSNSLKNIDSIDIPKQDTNEDTYIDFDGGYSFNTATNDFIFKFDKVKNIGKNIILPKTTVYAILQAYSNFDDSEETVSLLAVKYELSKFIIKRILEVMGMTHDSLPICKEQIEGKTDNSVVKDLLAIRKSNIYQKFQSEKWKEVQKDAIKWNRFKALVLNPFKSFLDTWVPPVYIPIKNNNYPVADKTYIATLSDLHFGNFTNKEYTYYSDKDWNINETEKALDTYGQSIKKELSNYKFKPKKCILLSLGDLIHSVSGFTDKNTFLDSVNPKGPLQFESTLNVLIKFINNLISSFSEIEVYSVNGNHDSFADWALMKALSLYYKDEKRISWNIEMKRWNTLIVGSNLFVIEHGYSAFYKNKVPSSDIGKEAYIQRLIINKMQNLSKAQKIKHNYFIMGDRHTYNQKDLPMFEFIILPTICKSDNYADNINLTSRSRQLSFLVDNDLGIISNTNHFV